MQVRIRDESSYTVLDNENSDAASAVANNETVLSNYGYLEQFLFIIWWLLSKAT